MPRLPVAFRQPGIRLLGHPLPPRSWACLAVGLPAAHLGGRTSTGFPRCTRMRCDRGGCPLYPGTAVPKRPVRDPRPPPAALQRQVPLPRCNFPPPRLRMTRHQRGFKQFTHPVFPLACDPRVERASLSFLPELHTPPLPAAHVEVGDGQTGTCPDYVTDMSQPSDLRNRSLRAPSCRTPLFCPGPVVRAGRARGWRRRFRTSTAPEVLLR